jgi:cytochrome b
MPDGSSYDRTPAGSRQQALTLTVWSRGVRLLHWTLALTMITSFATHEGGGKLHEWTGYVALGAATLRTVLGLAGSGRWRFSHFVRGASVTLAYARCVWERREARYLGHNPLGACMVLALLADAIATGLTGWLFTTDRFWGLQWLEELHSLLGHALIPLLILHLAGVVFTSWRHRENLVAAMWHGRKAPPGPLDVN